MADGRDNRPEYLDDLLRSPVELEHFFLMINPNRDQLIIMIFGKKEWIYTYVLVYNATHLVYGKAHFLFLLM